MTEQRSPQPVRAHSAIDPFSLAFFADPYPHHEAMREAGPAVRLERYGIWGMARHAEVHAALNDWKTFSSASGAGLEDFAGENVKRDDRRQMVNRDQQTGRPRPAVHVLEPI